LARAMLPQPPPPNSGPTAQTRPTTSEPPKDHPSCLRTDRECRHSVATSRIQPTGRDRSTRNPAIRRTSAAAHRRWDGSGGAGSAANWARNCSARSLGAACMAPWPDPGGAGVPAMPATEDDGQRWAPYYRPQQRCVRLHVQGASPSMQLAGAVPAVEQVMAIAVASRSGDGCLAESTASAHRAR
jgi:hypothetical protein